MVNIAYDEMHLISLWINHDKARRLLSARASQTKAAFIDTMKTTVMFDRGKRSYRQYSNNVVLSRLCEDQPYVRRVKQTWMKRIDRTGTVHTYPRYTIW